MTGTSPSRRWHRGAKIRFRAHEREAVIAEFRAKELVAPEEKAKGKGITGEPREFNVYPIATLNALVTAGNPAQPHRRLGPEIPGYRGTQFEPDSAFVPGL
jgi:hypothetical protein